MLFSMPYHFVMDSNGKPSYCTERYRFVKREKQFQWFGKVHGYLAVSYVPNNVAIEYNHKYFQQYEVNRFRF